MSIYQELKRRNVFKVAAAYVIVGWLTMQVGEVMAPALRLPDWALSMLAFFIILGLPLAVVFAWAFEMTPEGLKLERDVDRSQSITHVTGRKLNFTISGLMALALAFFIYDKFVLDPERDQADLEAALREAQSSGEAALPPPATEKSIAVLPFVNMSNDPDQEFFSDGISEELLNVLARYPRLRVAARTSSFQFKGQNQDVADIARQLRVSHVLEGSVRKAGDRIRITAQLIEADNGYHLWSNTYDRELTDVFAIQDEISAAIGDALKVTLELDGRDGRPVAPTVPESSDLKAFEEYMAGRQLINTRNMDDMKQAIERLRSALSLDQSYAPAHAQLAIAYIMLADTPGTYGDWSLAESEALAQPHIERALALDDQLAEAYGASALIHLNKNEFDDTIRLGQQALALNPSYADVMNWMHIAYNGIGLHKEAYEVLMAMLKVDPLTVPGRSNAAGELANRGQLDEARALAESLLEQSPANAWGVLGGIEVENRGSISGSVPLFLRALEEDPQYRLGNSWLGYIFGMLDLMPEAVRLSEETRHWAWYAHQDLEEAVAHFEGRMAAEPDSYTYRYRLARTLYVAGELDRAHALFEELLEEGGGRPLFAEFGSSLPSAWLAFLRQRAGNREGAEQLLAMVDADQAELERANKFSWWYEKTAAVTAALRGQDELAIEHLAKAMDMGGFEWYMLGDPALHSLSDRLDFQALEARLARKLAAEREAVLRLICLGDPETVEWVPLPETCAGVRPPA